MAVQSGDSQSHIEALKVCFSLLLLPSLQGKQNDEKRVVIETIPYALLRIFAPSLFETPRPKVSVRR